MGGTNTYTEDIIKVAGGIHTGKLYGYLLPFVCAPRNTCVSSMTVMVHRFPYVVLDAHKRWE